jgi:hypothetical protein
VSIKWLGIMILQIYVQILRLAMASKIEHRFRESRAEGMVGVKVAEKMNEKR